MPTPLLKTKLYIPATRSEIVARPRLLTQLAKTLAHKLTLLSAPAGFGKTTLLAEWLATTPPAAKNSNPRSAWVTLEEDDNDPARFWAYVLTAFENAEPGTGETALNLLQSPQPPTIEAVLTALINDLASSEQIFILALDDYHVIHTPAIHAGLQYLLEHLPANLHIVLTTRNDPPLPLAQLRARGQMIELRAAELRFTLAEAAAFLNQVMQLDLSDADIAALETRTEGWIASLQLAALAMQSNRTMQGRKDISNFIASFTGSNRYIISYLVEQVLDRQTEAVQTFLLQTSILTRMNAALCNAVTVRQDSDALIAHLDASNLFVVPLDDAGEWYRYHKLFADVLQHRLQKTQPALVPELHRRACAWCEQNGLAAEALAHALAASDFEHAARLIEANGDALLKRGEVRTLETWLDHLPDTVFADHPRLCLLQARRHALAHHLDLAEKSLQLAEHAFRADPIAPDHANPSVLNQIAVLRVDVALSGGDLARTIDLGERALATLPPDDARLRGSVLVFLGIAYFQTNQIGQAELALTQACQLLHRQDDLYAELFALLNLAAIPAVHGQIGRAIAMLEGGLALAAERTASQMPFLSWFHGDLAELLLERNQLEQAAHHLTLAMELGELAGNPRTLARALSLSARLYIAQGKHAAAFDALRQAEQLIEKYKLPLFFQGQRAAAQVRLWLASGDVNAATVWAQSSGLSDGDDHSYLNEVLYLALARVQIAQSENESALTLLERLRRDAELAERTWALIEILALESLVQAVRGEHETARAVLERALTLAQPEGFIRTFVDNGMEMKVLLSTFRTALEKRPSAETTKLLLGYTAKLLSAFEPSPAPSNLHSPLSSLHSPLPSPLSYRELAILRLIAAGHTNPEIANSLILAVGTVKKYTNTIFGKLAVTNRTQAVARARELGLL